MEEINWKKKKKMVDEIVNQRWEMEEKDTNEKWEMEEKDKVRKKKKTTDDGQAKWDVE